MTDKRENSEMTNREKKRMKPQKRKEREFSKMREKSKVNFFKHPETKGFHELFVQLSSPILTFILKQYKVQRLHNRCLKAVLGFDSSLILEIFH